MQWRTEGPDLFFCRDSCARRRDGLIADIVQIAAIAEIQRLGVMSNYTLVRKHNALLEKQLAAQEEREAAEYGHRLRAVE